MRWLSTKVIVLLLGSLLIIGCGGGGSNFNVSEEGTDTSNNVYIGGVSSIVFISATPQTIALKDKGGPTRPEQSVLVFKVIDEHDNPIPNEIVNFELSTEIGGLSLSDQSAVSDSGGLVRVTVNAGDVSTLVSVAAILDSNSLIKADSIELVVGGVSSIVFISATPQTIFLKGTGGPDRPEQSVLVFKVIDEHDNPIPNEIVNFELSTGIGGLSLSDQSAVSDSDGLVRVTVNAGNVSTLVSVTAILDSNTLIKVVSDAIFVGEAGSIDFISATPHIIALKGTGGPARSETSVLVFMVVDKYGNPVPNQTIHFDLSTEVGGLSLSNESAVSNSGGRVQVTVNAGNVPTHIRVHATLEDNPSIKVVSDELIVYEGLPDQNSISIFSKVVEITPDEWYYGKVELDIVFQAADHYNNFVPDGTVVYFTTEGGSIGGSATTSSGGCKVKWRSGNPIPDDEAITILAFCVGEESFIDVNGNGYFDDGDLFDESTDLAEPFRDDNENGVHDIGEEYWDYNDNGKFDGEPNGIYNGSLCSDESEALGKCTKELVYVRKSLTLMKAEVQSEWSSEEAASIDFISCCPQTIALKGTGGPARSETSTLVFKAVDKYGNPVPNQIMNFKLSTEIGGLSLSNESAVSNSEGLVRVTVNAGNISTHVRVHASLDRNPSITVVSDELAVSTGLPDQNSISISAEILNPEAWNYNNVEVQIIFQAADLFNNFVPDGTVVYFTTEGGSIIASSTIADGVCEVKWRSGNPRPSDGLFTILAFCIGEESFTDVNGNGIFEEEDLFDEDTDLAEPFRDDNQNGTYNYGEWFWDYNYNGKFDEEPNGKYNGTLCSDEAEALDLCTKELVYTHASISLIMSGSFANITFDPNYVDLTGGNTQTVLISIADVNNNPMPYDTEINVNTTNGKFIDGSISINFNVGNTNQPGPIVFPVILMPSEDDETSSGILQVEVTTPFGNKSMASIEVED